ncbi:MAG: PGN_0703 family putative restriction endonuclease [Nitrospirales bacterium]
MDQATRTRLERNIFPAAHQACEPWEKFPWHTWAHVAHSSQALAIDVFGSIKTSANRDTILDALAQTIGLPTGGPWDVTLEWAARPTLLNEPHPTQVDVYAESPQAVILFECKFTEQDGGACSQTGKRNGSIPCNGNYAASILPPPSFPPVVSGNTSSFRCALSEKGIQYWDIIPKVFHLDAQTDYQPCPFAGSAYQWMRNLVVAYKVGRQKNKQPAVVIVYAESPGLPMAQKGRSNEWTQFARTVKQEQVPLHVRSYQEILTLVQETTHQGSGEPTLWRELGEWVERKMSAINGARRKSKRKSSSSSNTMAANRNG